MKVLITGGSGYLGSMICYALSDNGHKPYILDICRPESVSYLTENNFYQGDIGDREILSKIFEENPDIEIVIHFAEKATVWDSVVKPYEYYHANVVKSMELFNNLKDLGCKKIIFASSAAIYDDVPGFMVTERSPINPRSPFARTKYMTEMILKDFCVAYDMCCIVLRFFNPVGADPKGRTGLDIKKHSNLLSRVLRIWNGEENEFKIAGNDWTTRDGTCIRDYFHIWDLALAVVNSVENFDIAFRRADNIYKNFLPINIGSGVGVTVKEFLFAFQNVTGEKIKIVYTDRRPGDVCGSYANINRAKNTIEWEAKRTIEDAIIDALKWEEIKKTKDINQ
ncbi:MAG: UDP-glucose 4-epimerase GalE [Clostridiales bacterium]|nr:UDP-glucose 4-epimerase GalE [Clostridiales bacterium]